MKPTLWTLACLATGTAWMGSASAVPVSAGGALTLGNSYTVANPSTMATSSAVDNNLTMDVSGGSFTYGDGFAGPQTAISATGVPAGTYGFYDNYVFTINSSNLDSITSTVSLGSGGVGTQIVNLDAQLFEVTGNPTLPSFTPSNSIGNSLNSTTVTLAPGVTATTLILNATAPLSAGEYVLEIRGDATGSAGGAYSGVLNITPVPVPAAAWLMVSGLGGVGLFAGRRRTILKTA